MLTFQQPPWRQVLACSFSPSPITVAKWFIFSMLCSHLILQWRRRNEARLLDLVGFLVFPKRVLLFTCTLSVTLQGVLGVMERHGVLLP